MITPVAVSRSQLLKYIHIPKLEIVMFVDMIIESKKKTILIKIIIDDLLSEIDMHFIIYYE